MTESAKAIIRAEFLKILRDDYSGNFDDIPLYELGIDSLDFFERLMVLEDEHNILIPLDELTNDVALTKIFAMLKL